MDWGGPNFVLAIIAISTAGWLFNNWIRAQHGYALEDEWGGKTAHNDLTESRKIELLTDENQQLIGKIDRLEERIAVLERIATDPARRTADEIEALREKR